MRVLHAILGIDAAWTEGEPSGVSLVVGSSGRWRCRAVAPSYESFVALADGRKVDWRALHRGSLPDAGLLLGATRRLVPEGFRDLTIAVDMPLSLHEIRGRRAGDDEISRAFGRYKCGVHSPTPDRPGRIATTLRAGFASAGFPLATSTTPPATPNRVLEVYPHTGLLALLELDERFRYKISKARKFWSGTRAEIVESILAAFRRIRAALARELGKIPIPLRRPETRARLKPLEDALDATVCAWIATEYLARRARPFGDDLAAVWSPPPPAP